MAFVKCNKRSLSVLVVVTVIMVNGWQVTLAFKSVGSGSANPAVTKLPTKHVMTPPQVRSTGQQLAPSSVAFDSLIKEVEKPHQEEDWVDHSEEYIPRNFKPLDFSSGLDLTAESFDSAVVSQSQISLQQPIADADIAADTLETLVDTTQESLPQQQEVREMTTSSAWQGRLMLLFASALYGTNFTLVKILDEHLPVAASTSLRFLLASAATLPFLFTASESIRVEKGEQEGGGLSASLRHTWPVFLAGAEVGLYNAAGYISQAIGLETTEASKSAFICSLAVVVVPLLDALAGKKALSCQSVVGVLCAVLGVGLLELGGGEGGGAGGLALSAGDLWTFAQPLAFGLGFWRMEAHSRRFPPAAAKALTAAQLLAVAAVSSANCFLLGPALGGPPAPAPAPAQLAGWLADPLVLGALLWTGLVSTGLTVYLETVALRAVSAAEATLLMATEPLWGAGFAAAVAGENLLAGPGSALGALLILGGCLRSSAAAGEGEGGH